MDIVDKRTKTVPLRNLLISSHFLVPKEITVFEVMQSSDDGILCFMLGSGATTIFSEDLKVIPVRTTLNIEE